MAHPLREQILSTHRLTLVRVFDTWEASSHTKDVVLGESPEHVRVIVRIGEVRDPKIFPNGFRGATIVVPRLLDHGRVDGTPYEIEEYIEGQMVATMDSDPLELLLSAFWEFQVAGRAQPLQDQTDMTRMQKFLDVARPLLPDPSRVQEVFDTYRDFWSGQYPSKWKFARDNLILTSDRHITLIDNARMGLRWFGYDLGWLIWPRWVATQQPDVAREEMYLADMRERWKALKPATVEAPEELGRVFDLVVWSRAIGALYDVVNQTDHLKHARLTFDVDPERTKTHVAFLQELLSRVMTRLV